MSKHINGKNSKNRVAHQYIVNFKPGTSEKEQERIIRQLGGKVRRRFGKGLERFLPVQVDDAVVEKLLEFDAVESIDQEEQVEAPALDETTYWGVTAASARNFWEAGFTGRGIHVCIIDTGVNAHSDLPNIIYGYNVDTNTADGSEISPRDSGHGTMSAGIIAARKNSSMVRGVAYECDISSIVCYYPGVNGDTSSYTTATLTTAALQHAYNMNPRPHVVLCNVQLSAGSSALQTACNNLVNAGIPILAAAGNYGTEADVRYPGRYSNVIAVGAATTRNTAPYITRSSSNYGPGLNITSYTYLLSTSKAGGIASYSGTSCAAPFATGVMALLKQAYPTYSATQLYDKLLSGAIPVNYGVQYEYGAGLINMPISMLPSPPIYPLVSSNKTENFEDSVFNFDLKGDWTIGTDGTRNVLQTGTIPAMKDATQTLKLRMPSTSGGTLEFDARMASSEPTFDQLRIFVNGENTHLLRNSSTYTRVSIPLEAGKSYRIEFEAFASSSTGGNAIARISNLSVTMTGGGSTEPDGSSFDKAITIGEGTTSGSIATGGASMYYKFVPATTGKYKFETWNSTLDLKMQAYNSSQSSLGTSDDEGNGNNPMLILDLTAGQAYYIRLFGYNSTTTGIYDLKVNKEVTEPPADGSSFSTAIPVGEGTHPGSISVAGSSKYYKFVPSTTGKYKFETWNNTLDLKMQAYNSSQVSLGISDDEGNGNNPMLILDLTAGQTYYIRLFGYSTTTTGTYDLKINKEVTSPTPVTITEDFEDTNYTFTFTGDWTDSNADSYSGYWSRRSKTISHNQESKMEFTVNIPTTTAQTPTLTFDYKVSSESNWDWFEVLVNGVSKLKDSGQNAWKANQSIVLGTGAQIITFRYYKDGSGSAGSDCAFVDNIRVSY